MVNRTFANTVRHMAQKLDRKRIDRLRDDMLQRHRELRESIAGTLESGGNERNAALAGAVRDEADESVADLLVDMNLAEIDRELTELRELDAALQRIREDTYGVCQNCGRDIQVERLEAYPTAALCIDCQQELEQQGSNTSTTL